jgi:hypothetical protein
MNYKKFLNCGPGGPKCACCFPSPGSKARKSEYRKAKKKEKKQELKLACVEV